MREMKINVLYAVDLEDNTKQSLMALPSGVRCPREVAESVVNDFFGPYQIDSDEMNVKEMVDAICEDRQIDLCDYTIFFDEVTMYLPEEDSSPGLDDIVKVTCYRQTEKITRREALNKYYEGMCYSEGPEHDRYETIFFQLMGGAKEASDEIDFRH